MMLMKSEGKQPYPGTTIHVQTDYNDDDIVAHDSQ